MSKTAFVSWWARGSLFSLHQMKLVWNHIERGVHQTVGMLGQHGHPANTVLRPGCIGFDQLVGRKGKELLIAVVARISFDRVSWLDGGPLGQ